MSVLINMEMPMNCCRCPCADLEYYDCNLMPGTGISSDRKSGKRRDDCPLIPVPDHGRLIDADALCETLRKLADNEYTPAVFANWIEYHIDSIIPADQQKEEA